MVYVPSAQSMNNCKLFHPKDPLKLARQIKHIRRNFLVC